MRARSVSIDKKHVALYPESCIGKTFTSTWIRHQDFRLFAKQKARKIKEERRPRLMNCPWFPSSLYVSIKTRGEITRARAAIPASLRLNALILSRAKLSVQLKIETRKNRHSRGANRTDDERPLCARSFSRSPVASQVSASQRTYFPPKDLWEPLRGDEKKPKNKSGWRGKLDKERKSGESDGFSKDRETRQKCWLPIVGRRKLIYTYNFCIIIVWEGDLFEGVLS